MYGFDLLAAPSIDRQDSIATEARPSGPAILCFGKPSTFSAGAPAQESPDVIHYKYETEDKDKNKKKKAKVTISETSRDIVTRDADPFLGDLRKLLPDEIAYDNYDQLRLRVTNSGTYQPIGYANTITFKGPQLKPRFYIEPNTTILGYLWRVTLSGGGPSRRIPDDPVVDDYDWILSYYLWIWFSDLSTKYFRTLEARPTGDIL